MRAGFRPAARSGAGVIRQRASGLRRQVPVPEHGASTSTTSAVPDQIGQGVGLAARIEQAGRDDRHARPRRSRRQPRQARAIGVGSEQRALDCPSRRPAPASCRPPPRRDRRPSCPAPHRAGERDDLAALVLHLDRAGQMRVELLRSGARLASAGRPAGQRSASPPSDRRRGARSARRRLTRISSGARSISAGHSLSATSDAPARASRRAQRRASPQSRSRRSAAARGRHHRIKPRPPDTALRQRASPPGRCVDARRAGGSQHKPARAQHADLCCRHNGARRNSARSACPPPHPDRGQRR